MADDCAFSGVVLSAGFVQWRRFSDGNDWGLLFVDLAKHDGPGGRFVAAATGGFVEAEDLECPGKGKEEQGGSDEDAGVEMDQA